LLELIYGTRFDEEPVNYGILVGEYITGQGYEDDFPNARLQLHHEIYLSDGWKVAPENLKTVIWYPIKKK